jgi:hypothetical protein
MHCIQETWQSLCAAVIAVLHYKSKISKHWILQHSKYSVADVPVLGKLVITLKVSVG